MGRNLAMTLVGSLVMVAGVSANAGPASLPKDRKVADPPVRFEGIAKYPDSIFYLYYHVVYSEGTTLVEVKDSDAFKLQFKRKDRTPSVHMTLFAMDRKDFDKRKKADPSLKWLLAEKVEGVPAATVTPPATTVPLTVKEIPVTVYQVAIKDGRLSASKVEEKKCADEPTGLLPPWTLGIVLSLSIGWLGIWSARRDGARGSGR